MSRASSPCKDSLNEQRNPFLPHTTVIPGQRHGMCGIIDICTFDFQQSYKRSINGRCRAGTSGVSDIFH